MALDLTRHPCFNGEAKGQFGRIHLPVAPKCNIQCNFCNRKYDCVNESRPGVTSAILTPRQALRYCREMVRRDARLAVVGIAGPGDPFANPPETMETLRLIRREFPEMLLCVATNGLNAVRHVKELAALKVSHLTITINAVNEEVGRRIYSWVRDGRKIYRGLEGAQLLLERQLELLDECRKHGLTVKINSILIPGINENHIPQVARITAERGADLFNCIGMCDVPDTPFADFGEPSEEEVLHVRRQAGRHLPLMLHCTRCRADAVGCLGEGLSGRTVRLMQEIAAGPADPSQPRPYIAVASREGLLINLHLGQARTLHIFDFADNRTRCIEVRTCPPAGGGDQRWRQLARILSDCRVLLASGAGPAPVRILKKSGLSVVCMEGLIQKAAEDLFAGKPLRNRSRPGVCSAGCGGNQAGCG